MAQQLESTGLVIERFQAINASNGLTMTGYTPASWGPYWTLADTEIACFESHRAIWSRIVEHKIPAAVIMEDDVLIGREFTKTVEILYDIYEEFDIIKLDGAGGSGYRFGPPHNYANLILRPIMQSLPSAGAYLLSCVGATKLLELSTQYSDHLDDFIYRPRNKWRSFQIFPAQAIQGVLTDLLHGPEIPLSIMCSERTDRHDYLNRGPVAYRILKELKRTSTKLSRLWQDKWLLRMGGIISKVPFVPELGQYRK